MPDSVIQYRFLVRGGTASAVSALNEVPKAREIVFETDTLRFKLGDGATAYNSLGYVNDNIYNFGGVANGVRISSTAGVVADLRLQTGLVDRWILRKNGDAESGANAGSKLELHARADDGTLIGLVFDIVRATRVWNFAVAPTIAGVTLAETIQDAVGAMFTGGSHTNITVNYNDTTGVIDLTASGGGGGGSGDAIGKAVAQVAHGLSVGMPIYYSGSAWAAADRDAGTTAADAIVSAVADANNFSYVQAGYVSLTTGQWDARTGASGGLTAGEYYFLSSTAGGLTATTPTTGYRQLILKAISTTAALVMVGEPFDMGVAGVTLVAQTTLSAAATDITVVGLDLATDENYEIELRAKGAAADEYCHMYINGDTTATNYYSTVFRQAGTSSAGNTFNTAYFIYCYNGMAANGTGRMFLDQDGCPRTTFENNYGTGPSNLLFQQVAHYRTTAGNVTSLTFRHGTASGWAAGSRIRVFRRPNAPTDSIVPGMVIGFARTTHTGAKTFAATTAYDSTPPINTDGVEYTELATTYTPRRANSLLRIRVHLPYIVSASSTTNIAAIHRDSTSAALNFSAWAMTGDWNTAVNVEAITDATATTATTFKLRIGSNSGANVYHNRSNSSATLYNNAAFAVMTVEEIAQ